MVIKKKIQTIIRRVVVTNNKESSSRVGKNISFSPEILKELEELVEYCKGLGIRTSLSSIVSMCIVSGIGSVVSMFKKSNEVSM